MVKDAESIPQAPPSPQQISVQLYSFVDVEHLLPYSEARGVGVPHGPMEPIPQHHSIQLHSLLDLGISSHERRVGKPEEIPEVPPLPHQLSIDLYSLADVEYIPLHSPKKAEDIPPSPRQLSVNLYYLPDVHQIQGDAEQHTLEHPSEIPVSPLQISVDLYPLDDVESGTTPPTNNLGDVHQDVSPHRNPVPAMHGISLYPLSELSNLAPAMDPPTEVSIPLVPVVVQETAAVGQEGYELRDIPGTPIHDSTSTPGGAPMAPSALEGSQEPHPDSEVGFDIPKQDEGGASDVQRPVSSGNILDEPVALAVREIVKACKLMKVYKVKNLVPQHQSKRLSTKAVQILDSYNDIASSGQASQLQKFTDELVAILEDVMRTTMGFLRYNPGEAFSKKAEIKEGLDRCEAELDRGIQLCQVQSGLKPNTAPSDQTDEQRVHEGASRDIGGLQGRLLDISSTTPAEPMQQPDAPEEQKLEELMAQGQKSLRQIREESSQAPVASGSSGTQPRPPTTDPAQVIDEQTYRQFEQSVLSFHRETGVPPKNKLLNGEVKRTSELAVKGGTYGEIWMGTWLGEEKVAMKALKNISSSDSRAKERLELEINTWSELRHVNILAFWGIVTDLDQHIYMVSPWQNNGNVLEYVRDHPDVNRLQLISETSQGLTYLHSKNIIHGNLKCANILVSSKGQACICDFGLAKIIEEVTAISASLTLIEEGSARWMAPELIEGKALSKETDIYSFAMAILEVLTGKHPYAEYERDAQVVHSVAVLHQPPAKPQSQELNRDETRLSDGLWNLMLKCWCKDAPERPSMTEICSLLNEINQSLASDRLGA